MFWWLYILSIILTYLIQRKLAKDDPDCMPYFLFIIVLFIPLINLGVFFILWFEYSDVPDWLNDKLRKLYVKD